MAVVWAKFKYAFEKKYGRQEKGEIGFAWQLSFWAITQIK